MPPSEFWGMTISETSVLYEALRGRQPGDYAGSLTQGDVDRLSALVTYGNSDN